MLLRWPKKLFILAILLPMLFQIALPTMVVYADRALEMRAIDLDHPTYEDNVVGCSANGATASTPVAGNIYILGDSITDGAAAIYNSPTFTGKGLTPTISAVAGRSWKGGGNIAAGSEGTTGPASTAVDTDAEAIKASAAIVIGLGTNGYAGDNPVDEIITKIKSINSTAPIWWINTANTEAGTPNPSLVDFNTQLDAKATEGKIKVISWSKTVDPDGDGTHDPAGLLRDGIHPTAEGYAKLVDLVVLALTTGSGGTAAPATTGCQCSVLSGNGKLSTQVPAPYHDIFIAAGGKHNVEPAALAAVFYKGEHGSSWPAAPPPYGDGPLWASRAEPSINNPTWTAEYLSVGSPNVGLKGSVGSAQFLFGTWLTQKDDGNGDGKFDGEDLTDASFAQAKFIAGLGGTVGADENALLAAFGNYNGSGPGGSYAARVMDYYKELILSDGVTGITGGGSSGSCSGPGTPNNGALAGKIVAKGLELAWKEKKDGFKEKKDATPAYQEAMVKYNNSTGWDEWSDCGVFVATVMHASGADMNYVKRFTTNQEEYMRAHPEMYEAVENVTSSDQLQPGDIIINSHHTMIFVGQQPEGFNTVDASQGERVPGSKIFAPHPSGEPYSAFRMKG